MDDPRWGVVERLVANPSFARSGRLTQFLVYVCTKALNGQTADINELQVGIHVFGRSESYSPAEDNIVRSHARLLRKRLEEYFEGEGCAEPYRIRIPKGGYIPSFEERCPSPPPETAVMITDIHPLAAPVVAGANLPRVRLRYLAFAGILIAVGVAFGLERHAAASAEGYSARFWGALCSTAKPTVVVPSDTALVMFEVTTDREIGLREYLSRDFRQDTAAYHGGPLDKAAGLANMPYTNMVDLQFCWSLARASNVNLNRTTVRSARDVRASDLQGSNVILIGARRANPWVELFDQANNFQGLHDARGDYILNRAPRAAERPLYIEHGGESYAVVSFVPGLNVNDRTLLINGTTTAGTDAGLEFVLNANSFGSFLKTAAEGRSEIPGFEVLLRTGNVDSRAPGRSEVIAFRRRPR